MSIRRHFEAILNQKCKIMYRGFTGEVRGGIFERRANVSIQRQLEAILNQKTDIMHGGLRARAIFQNL